MLFCLLAPLALGLAQDHADLGKGEPSSHDVDRQHRFDRRQGKRKDRHQQDAETKPGKAPNKRSAERCENRDRNLRAAEDFEELHLA